MSYNKKLFKVILDMLMLILLIFEMNTRKIGPQTHMILGLILFALFIIHNIVEFRWYRNLFKGHLTPIRFLSILINIALLLNMIIIMISAVFLPQFMSKHVPYSIIYTAKDIHTIAANWLFIIISIHLSLHPATTAMPVKKSTEPHSKNSSDYIKDFIKYAVLLLIFLYGIKAFIDRDILLKMIGIHSINEWKVEPLLKPPADYTCIMIVISYASYKVLKFIKNRNN